MSQFCHEVETVTLKRLKFAIQTTISDGMMGALAQDAVAVRAWQDHIVDQWVTQIELKIFSRLVETMRWPASWREAAKERFAPAWFTARWPVRYEARDVYALYPDVSLPGHEGYLHIIRRTEP